MSNQPQASVHKGATRTLPPATIWRSAVAAAGGTPGTVVCVCVRDPGRPLGPSPSPASAWGDCHANDRLSAGGQICPSPRVRVQSLWRLSFPFRRQRALLWSTQWYHSGSWKPRTEMRVQNKNELGSLQLKCSSYGGNVLSVVYECAMRNFQRAPFTIRHF